MNKSLMLSVKRKSPCIQDYFPEMYRYGHPKRSKNKPKAGSQFCEPYLIVEAIMTTTTTTTTTREITV
eukprot:2681112-Ditylum_brightwellii.AAC.1